MERDIKFGGNEKAILTNEAVIWHILARGFFEKNRVQRPGKRPTTITKLISFAANGENGRLKSITARIRLLLLFCDARFVIDVDPLSDKTRDYLREEAIGDLNHFYTKFLDELFKVGKSRYGKLFELFVAKKTFYAEGLRVSKQRGKPYEDYITLSLVEKSMLFRFKSLIQTADSGTAKDKVKKKVSKMILDKRGNLPAREKPSLPNWRSSPEDIREYNSWVRRRLNEEYSEEKFLKASGGFDEDFVDLLTVFYSYLSIRAAYKAIFK
jgi:hypothetical protein